MLAAPDAPFLSRARTRAPRSLSRMLAAADAAGQRGGASPLALHRLIAQRLRYSIYLLYCTKVQILMRRRISSRSSSPHCANHSVRDTLYPYLPPPPFDHAAAPPTPELAAFTAAVLARAGPPVSKVNAVCDLMCEALRAASGLPSPTVAGT